MSNFKLNLTQHIGNTFFPIFSKCEPRKLIMIYEPLDMLVCVHANNVVELYLPKFKEHLKIININEEIHNLRLKAQQKFDVTFDPDTKQLKKVSNIKTKSLVDVLEKVKDIIRDHYGVGWFNNEPMVMSMEMFILWCEKNKQYGMEIENVH